MKLKSILTAAATAQANVFDLRIIADLEDGAGDQTLPFTFDPADKFGLGPQVKAAMVDWLATGNKPTPYMASVIDFSQIDTDTLNSALIDPGSVVRGLALVVFGIAKGTISINPSLTQAQFKAFVKAQMR